MIFVRYFFVNNVFVIALLLLAVLAFFYLVSNRALSLSLDFFQHGSKGGGYGYVGITSRK